MIRSLTQTDRLAIGRIYCEAWKAAYRGIVPDDFLDRLTDESCAPRSVRTQGALVYEADGIPVGVVSFGARRDSDDPLTGEIRTIYVLPDDWRRGVGRALFDAARNELKSAGYTRIYLWVLTENRRARRFYESMGMTAIDRRKIIIGGRELDETGYLLI